MFVDSVFLTLTAGKGGNGVIAWRREKYIPKGGPTGGNGGHGGSIVLKADRQTVSLEGYRNRRIICADSGGAGGPNLRQGKTGKNLVLKVPCGTLIKEAKTGKVLFDLTEDGQEILLCRGGKGGKGNDHFKSPTHQAPHICTAGTAGESKEIELELKLIADVGLIGMPNAGKSTLMNGITYVPVKIGAYPFTTLRPNLGYAKCPADCKLLIADIPGIIKDAHENKGLGLSFLRHIERTSILIFVVDISGFEERNPIEDYQILVEELKAYKQEMLDKPFLVVLNKIDIEGALENIEAFRREVDLPEEQIFEISAKEREGLDRLLEGLYQLTLVKQSPEEDFADSCN
jgi:GTP-binding protein